MSVLIPKRHIIIMFINISTVHFDSFIGSNTKIRVIGRQNYKTLSSEN